MSRTTFGKRSITFRPTEGAAPAAAVDHADFFAAVRAELAQTHEERRMVVPRSFKAAGLAGLVVGCALAGFHVTGTADGASAPSPFATIAAALGTPIDSLPTATTPFNPLSLTMFAGLLGGARVAALTVIVVHAMMGWVSATSRTAYAIGGAAVSAALAAALLSFGHAPTHGWIVEILSGAAAGFLYRMFAGTRPAA